MSKYIISSSVAFIIVGIILISRLSDFSLPPVEQQRTLHIQHHQDILEGTLVLPAGQASPPLVVLIHGDGPQDRWSEDSYLPLVNFLVSQGVAVFSWDKPGVGGSTGNWLAQTMSDRAEESARVLEKLREQPELKKSKGGFIGFSQAGWVVPQASQLTKTDFAVLIGPAINWRNQGIYFTAERLKFEGYTADDIAHAKKTEAEDFDRQFTEVSVMLPCHSQCTRQDFERRNSMSDATKHISAMQTPVLILMGKDDRNVSPDETITVWQKSLPVATPHCIRQLPDTTHGLLRSAWFNYQLSSQWPLWKQGLFLLSGKYSYSPGALNTVSEWIISQKCES